MVFRTDLYGNDKHKIVPSGSFGTHRENVNLHIIHRYFVKLTS